MQRATTAWLITGIPGAGKTSIARALAERLPRSAHIEGDLVGEMVRSGYVAPGESPVEESERQLKLSAANQALLARSFAEAGFTPIIDFLVVGPDRVKTYMDALAGISLRLVVLNPAPEVALQRDVERPSKTIGDRYAYLGAEMKTLIGRLGLWIDTSKLTVAETVATILKDEARATIDASILRAGLPQ